MILQLTTIKLYIYIYIIYDSKKLLEDVKEIVLKAKKKENFQIKQPGL